MLFAAVMWSDCKTILTVFSDNVHLVRKMLLSENALSEMAVSDSVKKRILGLYQKWPFLTSEL